MLNWGLNNACFYAVPSINTRGHWCSLEKNNLAHLPWILFLFDFETFAIIFFIKGMETLEALNGNDNAYYNSSNIHLCFTWCWYNNSLFCESRLLPHLNVSMMGSHIKAKQLYEDVAVKPIQGQCGSLTAEHKMNKHRRSTGESFTAQHGHLLLLSSLSCRNRQIENNSVVRSNDIHSFHLD